NEKLDLFAALRAEDAITWSGQTRPPLTEQRVFPTTDHEFGLPTWVAVGGTPASVVRAAKYGLGLELAIIGGAPSRFQPVTEVFHKALAQFGHGERRIAVHSHGFVAETDGAAADLYWPRYAGNMTRIGRARGCAPVRHAQFEQEIHHGALHLGSPETVARKIATTVRELGATRFGMKYGSGTLPHEDMMRSIELYGTRVK